VFASHFFSKKISLSQSTFGRNLDPWLKFKLENLKNSLNNIQASNSKAVAELQNQLTELEEKIISRKVKKRAQ